MDHVATAPFGNRLRRYREAAGLSQDALAERAGLSARGISDLERGARRLPRLETVRLLADALQLDPDDRGALLAAARPPAAAPDADSRRVPPAAVPVPLTPLIGRQAELAELGRLLGERRHRLVTLTGPGGGGKTRLALAAAHDLTSSFANGAGFIPLASVREPSLVMLATTRALDVRVAGDASVRGALEEALQLREMLLVFDNFEQVAEAGAELAAVLAACPGISALVTSRSRLRLRGERIYVVPPLPLAAANPNGAFVDVRAADAVQLFVERARSARPDFRLSPDNAHTVADICRRLDGLPLALELAASRIRVLSPAALLARLGPRLPLLTDGARDLPDRQRTMRAAIAWSFALLSASEQTLFCWLAVGVGGVAIETVDALAAAAGLPESLEPLASLVESSLIESNAVKGAARFTMLEIIREFGLDQLAERGELDAAQAAHARHLGDRAEALRATLFRAGQEEGLAWFETERANLRVALAWLIAHDPAQALHMTFCLDLFWYYLGEFAEGLRWTERARAANQPSRSIRYARGYSDGALFAICLDDWSYGVQQAEVARDIVRALGDESELAYAVMLCGWGRTHGEQFAVAAAELQEALSQFERLGDRTGMALTLGNLADLERRRGHAEQREVYLQESLALQRELHDWGHAALTLLGLADLVDQRGACEQSFNFCHEALTLLRESGVRRGLADVLLATGSLAVSVGDLEAAERHFREAIAAFDQAADHAGAACAYADLADLHWRRTDRTAALDLYQAALDHWRQAGSWATSGGGCLRFARLAGRLGLRAAAAGLLTAAAEARTAAGSSPELHDRRVIDDVHDLMQKPEDKRPRGVGRDDVSSIPGSAESGLALAVQVLAFAQTSISTAAVGSMTTTQGGRSASTSP